MFKVAFLLTPEFSLVNVASAIDALRVANTLLERAHYAWALVSDTTRDVPSSSGIALRADEMLAELKEFDLLLVCGSFKPHKHVRPDTQRLLRRFARHGRMLGSMEAGVFHLASSGALDGHSVTAHWANMPAYAKLFPKVRFVRDVFTFTEKRVSCAGGLSGLDLMARLVKRDFGASFAQRVANLLLAPWLREEGEPQSGLMALSGNRVPRPVQEACRMMEQRLDAPIPVGEIARRLRLSRRQLDRQFKQVFAATTAEVGLQIRIARARKLLRSTRMELDEVAESCGFASTAHFSRTYKKIFGTTPGRERRQPSGRTAASLRLMPVFDLHPDQTQHDPDRLL